jgi:hypothetical protein
MTNRKTLVALLALAMTPGCSVQAGDPLIPVTLEPDHTVRPLAPVTIAESPLEGCLGAGGELVEIASVDNNDQHDHGALLTFGVSPSGILAAAGEDGTLKFWTLDAELIGTVDGSLITYGAEVGASPITDVAFMGEMAVVGDVRGLVQQMGSDGTFGVIGGTSPDVPIVAVAFDEGTGRFAHAQMGDVVPLAVHSIDGSSEAVDIEATLDVVRDIAFAPNGELWVAGATGGAAAIEIRDASDPSVVVRNLALGGAAPVTEIALSADGATAVLVASDFLYVVTEDGVSSFPGAEHGASSVAITRRGAFAVSIGVDGALVAQSSVDGREVARVAVARPVTVRVDATDRLVLVGGQDAIIHAFSCEL